MDSYNSSNELDKLFFEADNHLKEGYVAKAYDLLLEIIGDDPEYGKAYNNLGWIYENSYKNYAKAGECYRLALRYAPDFTPVYLNYASLLNKLEKFDELNLHLEKALEVPGINKSKIWHEYGVMYELTQVYDKAIQSYRNSIKYSLNNEDIEEYEKAVERCKKKRTQLFSEE